MYVKSAVILIIIAIFAGTAVFVAFAADNTVSAGNPSGCITDVCKQFEVWKGNFLGFLRWLFPVGIATAGVLSVVMIIFAGFQWMAGAISPPQIEAAKSRIAAALGGLFLALVSWIVLNTINPDLVTLRNPANLDKLKLQCPEGGCPKLEDVLFGETTLSHLSNDQKQYYDVCKNNGGSPTVIQRGAGFQVQCTPSITTRLTTPLTPTSAATAELSTKTIKLTDYNITTGNADQIRSQIENQIKKYKEKCVGKSGNYIENRNTGTQNITLNCLKK